jgi:hypothetical protein
MTLDEQVKKVFMICPVRNATDEEKEFLQNYMDTLESQGVQVHYPPRDTNQVDPEGGINICTENRAAIRAADEVHIYWNASSSGSGFDLGMTFQIEKPLKLINREYVKPTEGKSFQNVVLALDKKYNLE